MYNITETAKDLLTRRYLRRDDQGKVTETIQQLFERVALAVTQGYYKGLDDVHQNKFDLTYQIFKTMMESFKFLPNSPALMNAGTAMSNSSACFIVPVEDDMQSIFNAIRDSALISQAGGGCGYSFSNLRPAGDIVKSSGGTSSGPISFMQVFDAATEAVKQGGRRKGANMAQLICSHPDILRFITCKDKEGILRNFNITVALTDKFMEALEGGYDYELINPRDNKVVGTLNAGYVFNLIAEQAYKNGEPGVAFIDTVNRFNPTPELGRIAASNPCGEFYALPLESCNLGSINLAVHVVQDDICWNILQATTRSAVKFLDSIIDLNHYPLQSISDATRRTRKIGLGVMGWADALCKLKIPYNSPEALELAEKVMSFISVHAKEASIELDKLNKPGRNPNKQLTVIAPTGSISMIANCSPGIEPLFALAYRKNVLSDQLNGKGYVMVNPIMEAELKARKLWNDEVLDAISSSMSIQDCKCIPPDMREVFVTAHDLKPIDHVNMQAAFQKYTDNAVSKTTNMPNTATVQDVKDVYLAAYKKGCKGITVYRDGSRLTQVVNVANKPDQVSTNIQIPSTIEGKTVMVNTGCGVLRVTLNCINDIPVEVFVNIGKSGGCQCANSEALGRMISLALRSGSRLEKIIEQLEGIRCPYPSITKEGNVLSCPDAVSKVLKQHMTGKIVNLIGEKKASSLANIGLNFECPDCGEKLTFEEGCMTCKACGLSKCG